MQAPDIGKFHRQITPVGSRVTCRPAPTNTDQDWLVLVGTKDYDAFADHLEKEGWAVGGSRIPEDVNYLVPSARFNSFTKGEHNLIITASNEFHQRFLAATSVAKRLNLLMKDDRIALFQAVLYSASLDPEYQQATPFDSLAADELEEIF